MEVCIVGAGIAGLTCARILSRNGVKVTVIEARNRLGGRIHTWDLSSQSTYNSADDGKGRNLVDLGGSFVHGDIGNPLTALQKDAGYQLILPERDANRVWLDCENGQRWTEEKSDRIMYFAHATVFEGLSEVAQRSNYEPDREETIWSGLLNKDVHFLNVWKDVKEEEEPRVFALLKMWTGWTGSTFNETSLKWWGFEQEYIGHDKVVQPGYQKLIEWNAEQVEKAGGRIHKEESVSSISFDKEADSKGITVETSKMAYKCDYAISTLPLGVLKHADSLFHPPLPKRKRESIANLGMGLLNKIVLSYDFAWWKESNDKASWFAILPSKIATERDDFAFPQERIPRDEKEAQWLLLNAGLFCQDYTTITGQNTLVVFLGPPAAFAQELLSDEWVVKTVHERIFQSVLPKDAEVSPPISHLVTRWWSDSCSRGSYTYFQSASKSNRGSNPCNFLEMARPVWNARLGFAGEHTSVDCFASVHGALLSGEREANHVLHLIELEKRSHS